MFDRMEPKPAVLTTPVAETRVFTEVMPERPVLFRPKVLTKMLSMSAEFTRNRPVMVFWPPMVVVPEFTPNEVGPEMLSKDHSA